MRRINYCVAILLVLGAASCATVDDAYKELPLQPVEEGIWPRGGDGDDLAIALAISGGGFRSTYYALGALAGLDEIESIKNGSTLLDDLDYVSTVSGGSIAGALYMTERVLHQDDTGRYPFRCLVFNDEEDDDCPSPPHLLLPEVLDKNLEYLSLRTMLNPLAIARRMNRGDALEKTLDDLLPDRTAHPEVAASMTYRDLYSGKVKLPEWIANATIYGNGRRFPFWEDTLVRYGVSGYVHRMRWRDLKNPFDLPIAVAVKASASFPVLIPTSLLQVSYPPPNGEQKAYLQLTDGGIADNLGVDLAMDKLCADPATNKVLVIIDAYPGAGHPAVQEPRGPWWPEVLVSIGTGFLHARHDAYLATMIARANRCNVHLVPLGFGQLVQDDVEIGWPGCKDPDPYIDRSSIIKAARAIDTRLTIDDADRKVLLRAGREGVRRACAELVDREFVAEASSVLHAGNYIFLASDEKDHGPLWKFDASDLRKREPIKVDDDAIDDIEAMAKRRNADGSISVYVVSSHSRTKKKEKRKEQRERILRMDSNADELRAVDRTQCELRKTLISELKAQGILGDADQKALETNDPEHGGLNIEGAAFWNEHLLLGLRDPVAARGDKQGAMVVALKSPDHVADGCVDGQVAQIGKVMIVEAGPNEGIRSIEALEGTDEVVVVLGPTTASETSSGDLGEERIEGYSVVRWNPATGEVRKLKTAPWMAAGQLEGLTVLDKNRWILAYDIEARALGRSLRIARSLE